MNQQLTENEIEKVVEHLNYSNQTDVMAQKLFFDQTENIRQQRINNEKIIEVLKNIASVNPSESARKEASKTLIYLGITPPPTRETAMAIKILRGSLLGFLVDVIFLCILTFISVRFGGSMDGVPVGLIWTIISIPGLIIGGLIGVVIGAMIGRRINEVEKYVFISSICGGVIGAFISWYASWFLHAF